MAGGGSVLSSRLATENQNTDDTLIFETVFRHFKRHKVEISTAIKKTFPFLEGLRDRELITNRMYEDCQDSCRNLVPVSRVVYNVLNELEKTFDMSLLDALFSEVNRQEYPDLNHIYESFRKVIQEKIHHEESNGEEREERPTLPLSLEQGTWENSCQGRRESSSYDGTTSPENGLLDHLCETEEINAKRKDTTSDQNDALESQQANEQFAQESEPAAKLPNHGLQINSCSVLLVDIKKEKPCFNPEVERQTQARTDCNQASDVIVISSEDSAESSDGDESPEPSTSAPRKASDPWDIDNTSICSISSRKRRISSGDTSELSNEDEPQETSSSVLRNGSDTTDIGSDSTLGKHSEKRRRKTVNTGPLKRGRKRGPRIPKETNMDFQLPELPVTCGEAKGILYKEKMNKGTSEKCIQNAYGKWFTLREFEIEGNHEASKNWKLSVRCCGWPLKTLIQRKFLPNPSRKRKKPENSNECEVCHRKTALFSCNTCSRFFHEKCHIPPKGADRNPWSCIFCKIKVLQERCPESQPCHQESEVLKKLMLPEEKLKCEFLLLKVYCSPKSSFFASEPYYTSQGPEEPMWLNKIKKNLTMNIYHQVQGFVQDMRLIFQNYRTLYKNKKSINLGLQLEAEFENDFKNIFGIHEISTNSNRFEPISYNVARF
ncbi:nuclear autoantigen Sp-100 isoform X2 [Physeter macrocephalus]|uniref:Nuclear autoantigen Sp-100 isoform X2 n=1 Tax=Physeter macrocephalus TaxID=9755 RepID=A0A2Y9SUS7_PHYMC|nr:nuclear autoantigen Sp-100 isoform X2 [Physeter catodon]|eukprot:XP_023980265.1 nuclear body protein SP140-like protein isoform X2 [Physeter catodon]